MNLHDLAQDLLVNWPYKTKYNGKLIDSYLCIDKNIPYWKLHRFRFSNLLYGIPYRTTENRYKPIINNKKDPLFIRLRTKVIYVFIKLYFFLIAVYLILFCFFSRGKGEKKREKYRKQI